MEETDKMDSFEDLESVLINEGFIKDCDGNLSKTINGYTYQMQPNGKGYLPICRTNNPNKPIRYIQIATLKDLEAFLKKTETIAPENI